MRSLRAHGSTRRRGSDRNRSSPSRFDENLAASWPFTLLPAPSSRGPKVPSAPLPGATATIPPPIPLLPGSPTEESHSPDVSYRQAVVITASAARQLGGLMTWSPVTGCIPPSASVASGTPIDLRVMCQEPSSWSRSHPGSPLHSSARRAGVRSLPRSRTVVRWRSRRSGGWPRRCRSRRTRARRRTASPRS